jgi:hypothetical protein
LDRARKVAYIRSNSGSGVRGADEEVMLSIADVLDEEEGGGRITWIVDSFSWA